MTRRSLVLLVLPVLAIAAAMSANTRAAGPEPGGVGATSVLYAADASRDAAGFAGRYKKDGNMCQWDANDSGPNQCTPQTAGRFVKAGDACRWDGGSNGADECTPAKGRFKKEGNTCVWNGSDDGPNQCNPRQVK